ncbi:MAG: HAD-IA family hydrolase [Candidatus Paceibacterota bacterium]
MHKKIILFDFFGVLSGSIYTNIIEKFLPTEDYNLWLEKLNEHDKGYFSEIDFVKMISRDSGITEKEIWVEVTKQFNLNIELLLFIKNIKNKHGIGLLTNATKSLIERVLGSYIDIFDRKFISSEIGLLKPDPNIFKYVLSKIDTNHYEIIFIDDNPINIEVAKSFGIKGILYKNNKSLFSKINKF